MDVLDTGRRRLRLDHVDAWCTAHIDITASTTETTPVDIDACDAVVVVSCTRTNVRIPFVLDAAGIEDDGRFEGRVVLERSVLAGAAELTVDIAATIEGRRRLVGMTEPWSVIADADSAPTPPGKPPFETAWLDFADPKAPDIARHQSDAYSVMNLLGPKPTLLLNEGIDGLKALLLAATARNERRRLRGIIGTAVARQAVAMIFRAAAAEVVAVDDDASEPQVPSDPLYRQACEAVAGAMTTTASVDELYDSLLDAERGPAVDRARLWAEIDAAVDRLTGHSSAVASVVTEVKYV
jgi:hypothetical protein